MSNENLKNSIEDEITLTDLFRIYKEFVKPHIKMTNTNGKKTHSIIDSIFEKKQFSGSRIYYTSTGTTLTKADSAIITKEFKPYLGNKITIDKTARIIEKAIKITKKRRNIKKPKKITNEEKIYEMLNPRNFSHNIKENKKFTKVIKKRILKKLIPLLKDKFGNEIIKNNINISIKPHFYEDNYNIKFSIGNKEYNIDAKVHFTKKNIETSLSYSKPYDY